MEPEVVGAGSAVEIEDYIRMSAKRGLSKTQVCEALGLCRETFYAMLEAMPPLEWPAPGKSLGHRLSNESRRGTCSPALRAAAAKAVAVRKELHSHEFNGARGTIEELAKQSGVSASTVRRRMNAGMSLSAALTTPFTPPAARRSGLGKSGAAA